MTSRILSVVLVLSLVANLYLVLHVYRLEQALVRPVDTIVAPVEETVTDTFQSGETYPFLRVVDGDTVTVGIGTRAEYVRIIGIDAPEPNDPGGPECYANESTEHLTALLSTGTVRIIFDPTQGLRDKYNRLLAYVELPDGTDAGLAMLENGFAREYLYDAPYERRGGYLAAEQIAAREQRGLWGAAPCTKQ